MPDPAPPMDNASESSGVGIYLPLALALSEDIGWRALRQRNVRDL